VYKRQAFVQVRIGYYQDLISDPAIIRASRWGHTMAVLDEARRNQCLVALATMSSCAQAGHILAVLNMTDHFDFIATRDDVNHAKPNPEIYELVSAEMNVNSRSCLVIEDSPAGIQAALSAGMHCIAMTTPYTRDRVHAVKLLDPHWIVDDPDQLLPVVQELISERVVI
jgi:beta-phosphoglucomutase-like phosphatase (HAD superfamily)